VVVAPAIVNFSFAIAAMPEGSQKFASESIFNFNFIFKLKFEFRVWEHLVSLGLVVFAQEPKKNKKNQKKTKTKTKTKTKQGGLVYW